MDVCLFATNKTNKDIFSRLALQQTDKALLFWTTLYQMWSLWTESNVRESSWGLFFCVWVVSICQLSVPVRDIQSCHFSSASICEAFCSCYTTHTVLIEGQLGILAMTAWGKEGGKRDVRTLQENSLDLSNTNRRFFFKTECRDDNSSLSSLKMLPTRLFVSRFFGQAFRNKCYGIRKM